jgi:hypothetical protein
MRSVMARFGETLFPVAIIAAAGAILLIIGLFLGL